MAYTVKNLSELSGVTVRTLHFYEEEDLLKPAYYGSNGYRYYEEKQLLLLQQILFFKELGFSLKQIRKVLERSDFDQLASLYSHKQALTRESQKISQLIETVGKTIKHLEGKTKMKDNEIFKGFNQVTVGKGDESYFAAEALVLKNLKKSSTKNQEEIAKVGYEIYRKVAECMQKGLKPGSPEVEILVRKHLVFSEEFHAVTKEVYKALSILYVEHPVFRSQLDSIHPELAEFLSKAMNLFAERELI